MHSKFVKQTNKQNIFQEKNKIIFYNQNRKQFKAPKKTFYS